jgi:hypothetical protein
MLGWDGQWVLVAVISSEIIIVSIRVVARSSRSTRLCTPRQTAEEGMLGAEKEVGPGVVEVSRRQSMDRAG